MTKMIRVENADGSDYKVRIYIEDLIDGQWVRSPTPVQLDYPCAMTSEYIHGSRRIVVEESDEQVS